MKNIIGLHAYKKEGELSNLIGIIEVSKDNDFTYQLKLETGSIAGFNHLEEITIIEFGG